MKLRELIARDVLRDYVATNRSLYDEYNHSEYEYGVYDYNVEPVTYNRFDTDDAFEMAMEVEYRMEVLSDVIRCSESKLVQDYHNKKDEVNDDETA